MLKYLIAFYKKGYFYIFIATLLFGYFMWVPKAGVYDWSKELYYIRFIRESFLTYKQIPFIWWDRSPIIAYPAVSQSSIFLSNPETMVFSPFIFLLKFFDSLTFIKCVVVIHMVIGIIGSFYLKKRLSWKDAQFRLYLILFLFSPIIMQHICVGYIPWFNLFYFPWFFYFLLEPRLIRQSAGLAMIFGLILLQGGVHVLVWMIVFLGVVILLRVLFEKKPVNFFVLVITGVWSMVLSFVRIVYTSATFHGYEQEIGSGYRFSNFLSWAIKINYFPEKSTHYIEQVWHGIGYWDGAIYWGPVLILLFIFLFIVIQNIWKAIDGEAGKDNYMLSIFLSAIILLIVSFFDIYASLINVIVDSFHIPFIKGAERYAYRFAIPAFFGIAFVLAHYVFEIRNSIYYCLRSVFIVLFDHKLFTNIGHEIIDVTQSIKTYLLNIWGKRKRMEQRNIQRIIRYSWLLFLGMILLFIGSILFSKPINQYIAEQVTASYYGDENSLLTRLMENRDVVPVEQYIQKILNKFSQIQNILLLSSSLFLLVYLIFEYWIVIKQWIQSAMQDTINGVRNSHRVGILFFELLVFLPLLYSTWMWTWLGTSTKQAELPALSYQLSSPSIEIIPYDNDNNIPNISATPSTLMISNEIPMASYFLANIPSSDIGELEIISDNATLQKHWGGILIKTFGSGDVILNIREEKFYQSISITVIAWVMSLIYLFYPKWKNIRLK